MANREADRGAQDRIRLPKLNGKLFMLSYLSGESRRSHKQQLLCGSAAIAVCLAKSSKLNNNKLGLVGLLVAREESSRDPAKA